MEPYDFDAQWDYQDPEATEARFRELLEGERGTRDAARTAELLTQIARAQGLQQRFDEAHATLDEAEALLDAPDAGAAEEAMDRARVRCNLERGRALRSSGDPAGAGPFFEAALELARERSFELHAVDAAHMLALLAPGEEGIDWTNRALELAEAATDPRARGWRGALWNNLGWARHEMGRHEEAKEAFERHLEVRTEEGNEPQIGIARWSIAKMLRYLGQVERALEIQRGLLDRAERRDNAAEGYTREEVGECLLALGREEEARPHFARAWELLHDDPWLRRDEGDRLERLRERGGLADG